MDKILYKQPKGYYNLSFTVLKKKTIFLYSFSPEKSIFFGLFYYFLLTLCSVYAIIELYFVRRVP